VPNILLTEEQPKPEIQIMPILPAPEVKKVKKEKKAKPAATILSKKMSADVQKWNMKSKELSETTEEPTPAQSSSELSTEQKNKIWESIKSANASLSNALNSTDKSATTVRIWLSDSISKAYTILAEYRCICTVICSEYEPYRNHFWKCLSPLQTKVQLSGCSAKACEGVGASQSKSGEIEAGARGQGGSSTHARS